MTVSALPFRWTHRRCQLSRISHFFDCLCLVQTAILTGLTTTTTTLTTVTTTTATTTTVSTQPASPIITSTTIAPVTSGGASASIIPTTTVAGRRRRRSIVPPVQVTTYMPIGGCLVISLDNTTKFIDEFRRDYAFVKHLPLGIQLVQGVDGQTIDLYRLLREEKISRSSYNQLIVQSSLVTGHNLTLGSLGCLQSHVRAWEQVVQANTPMLILEDDVRFNRQLFDSMLPYLLYSLPTNFSLLYFGNLIGHVMESQLTDYNELLWKMNGSNWGTYAYLISPQGAAALLEYVYPAQAQVDSTIINIALSQSLNVFMSKQLLVKTENKFRRRSKTQRYLVSPIVIPQVFHFIWLGAPMKPAHQRNIDLWGKLHPKWEIRLWTMDSLAKSGLTMYNKDQWAKFSRGARQAADILRYEIIYQYGGIYVDVDFEPLRSLEPILHGVQAFVAHESEPFVCNGIFGAVPGHELSERLVMGLESSMITFQNGTVNQQTGPYHMTRQIDAMREEGKTTMKLGFETFAPHVFFPYAWYEKDPGAPYDSLAYTVHHFRSMQEIEQDFKAGHWISFSWLFSFFSSIFNSFFSAHFFPTIPIKFIETTV